MELIAHAVHKLTVPDSKPVCLAPLGDIQWSGRKEEIAYQKLKDHIARGVDRDAWWIGTGDYLDFMSPSNRQRLRAAALYDAAERTIDDKAQALADELYETLLAPTTGRWLGMVEGHHFSHLLSGETTDQYLCRRLKTRFLGTCGLIGLAFPTRAGTRMVSVWVHHGAGGGTKVHAPILKLENLSAYWEDIDVFIVGHMSKRATAPIPRVRPVWRVNNGQPTIREREVHLVGSGAWLLGYQQGSRYGPTPRGSYVEQKMLNPVALGAPFITITPRMRQHQEGRRQHKPIHRLTKKQQVTELSPPTVSHSFWEPEIRVEA